MSLPGTENVMHSGTTGKDHVSVELFCRKLQKANKLKNDKCKQPRVFFYVPRQHIKTTKSHDILIKNYCGLEIIADSCAKSHRGFLV